MNLFPDIEKALREQIEATKAKTVSVVWSVFKSVIFKSGISAHKNVTDCSFNSECIDYEGKRYVRIGLEYRLEYEIDNEGYEHSEDINCEFVVIDMSHSISKEDNSTGIDHPISLCTLDQMFENIEDWVPFKLYKDEVLDFTVNACEI